VVYIFNTKRERNEIGTFGDEQIWPCVMSSLAGFCVGNA
jgi:hypothetical protein